MPATRSDVSGLSSALAASRFAARGNAAKSSPSMTSTRPIAAMNWPSLPNRRRGGEVSPLLLRRRVAGLSAALTRLARRIHEVAKELRIRLEQHARVVGAQSRFVGLHRTVEREEVGVARVGIGENAIALGVALAAGPLALGLRLGEQHRDIAIRLGADLLRLLGTLGAVLRGLLLTLGLHALVDRLAVLLRQVGAPYANVDDGDAEGLRLVVELLAHARHQMLALVAHDLRQRGLAQHAAQRRVEQDRELRVRALDRSDGRMRCQTGLEAVEGG